MSASPFARDPVRITLARERVTLPYAPAAAWISAVCGNPSTSAAILPLLAEPDRMRVTTAMARGRITADDTAAALYEALRTAIPGGNSPVPWWESYRLLALSATPAAASRMLLAGLDPDRLPAAAWCYALYELMTKDLDAKGRFRFDAALREVPPGAVEDDGWGDMSFDDMVASARNTPGMG